MAAGIPVVVSDWDGYRYTVSDGIEGFRIPTLAPSHSQQGEELALQHDHGLSYQDYVGAVAQHVAVDTEAAAAAIACLAEDPALRQRMVPLAAKPFNGANWPVVAGLHHQLCAELAERRSAERESFGVQGLHPLRSDPFRDFAPFATACLRPDTSCAWPCLPSFPSAQQSHQPDRCYEQLHASPLTCSVCWLCSRAMVRAARPVA